MPIADPAALLRTLCGEPTETEWLEVKQNLLQPDEVGKYASALANSAMLANQPYAYLIYGVSGQNHKIVGTRIRLKAEKVGAEPLENWLIRALEPRLNM